MVPNNGTIELIRAKAIRELVEPLHKIILFKTLPCYQFSFNHWPFRVKICYNNFRIFLKNFQSLYDFPYSLNLNLKFHLS